MIFNNQTCQVFSDPDGDALTLNIENVPDGLTITDAGGGSVIINGTPTIGQSPWSFTITANDGNGGISGPHNVELLCTPIMIGTGAGPSFDNCPTEVFEIELGDTFTFQMQAGDPEGDNIIWSIIGNSGASIDQNGLISYTPTSLGMFSISVNIHDGRPAMNSICQFAVTVVNSMASQACMLGSTNAIQSAFGVGAQAGGSTQGAQICGSTVSIFNVSSAGLSGTPNGQFQVSLISPAEPLLESVTIAGITYDLPAPTSMPPFGGGANLVWSYRLQLTQIQFDAITAEIGDGPFCVQYVCG